MTTTPRSPNLTVEPIPQSGNGAFAFIWREAEGDSAAVGMAGFKGREWLWTGLEIDGEWVEVEDEWR